MGAGASRRRRSKSRSKGASDKKEKSNKSSFGAVWRKRKAHKTGPMAAQKLPAIPTHPGHKNQALKLNRVKDWVLLEEEYLQRAGADAAEPLAAGLTEKEVSFLSKLRGSPMTVGVLEDMVDEDHAIVSVAGGQLPFYVPVMSMVDKDKLIPNAKVLLSKKGFAVVGVLDDETSTLAIKMLLEKVPKETFADIGGLEDQIRELREVIELPLSKPELFEDMGVRPQKGCILYGPPGTEFLT
ncbi:26S proteasome regulatory subunit 4 [Halotydeus destructor]|nr:26S proteasome regulatory subunit 4 [Halotydeus destructor]